MTITIQFKKSRSKFFQSAIDACSLVKGFRMEGGYYIVSFEEKNLYKKKEAFYQFQEIYRYVGNFKDIKISIVGEGIDSSYKMYEMLDSLHKYNFPQVPSWLIEERKKNAEEIHTNPFNEFTEKNEWANWEIDHYKKNFKK